MGKKNCLRGENNHLELFQQMLTSIRRIIDDGFEYTLRLFCEEDTGVVRLQASVHTGALKGKPIWTAFITHQMLSPEWLSHVNPRVIYLADPQQYIFTRNYNPRKTSSGHFGLTFTGALGKAPTFVCLILYANTVRCSHVQKGH